MTLLYRVLPYLPLTKPHQPGGALFLPGQGGGRIDNPEAYSVLYASDAPAGAVAEAFGRFPEWSSAMLEGSPSLPGSARALARYRLPTQAPVCDLDDPARLLDLSLRPSDIVTRDYHRSRAWARRIHARGEWSGVRWWSYYDPQWSSFGLWDIRNLAVEEVAVLRISDPAIREAARVISRRVV